MSSSWIRTNILSVGIALGVGVEVGRSVDDKVFLHVSLLVDDVGFILDSDFPIDNAMGMVVGCAKPAGVVDTIAGGFAKAVVEADAPSASG